MAPERTHGSRITERVKLDGTLDMVPFNLISFTRDFCHREIFNPFVSLQMKNSSITDAENFSIF